MLGGISSRPAKQGSYSYFIFHTFLEMFAIVEISGEQFKIDGTSKTLRVPYMADAKAGQKVNFGKSLVSQGNDGAVAFGTTAALTATVIGHIRGEKVIVFHKKRRKRYRKTNGHTPRFTELAISW